jgi:hypothetical protein
MIAKHLESARTKDASRSWQTRYFGADFDDREGFTTAWSSKVFAIMERGTPARGL